MSQKVIIPKGLIKENETTIIEIPENLLGLDTIVAKEVCSSTKPESLLADKSSSTADMCSPCGVNNGNVSDPANYSQFLPNAWSTPASLPGTGREGNVSDPGNYSQFLPNARSTPASLPGTGARRATSPANRTYNVPANAGRAVPMGRYGDIMNTTPPNTSMRSDGSSLGLLNASATSQAPCSTSNRRASSPGAGAGSRAPTSRHRSTIPEYDSTPNRGLPSPERVKGREFIYNPAVQAAANSQFDRSWERNISPNFMDSLLGSSWDDTRESQIGIPRGSDGARPGSPQRHRIVRDPYEDFDLPIRDANLLDTSPPNISIRNSSSLGLLNQSAARQSPCAPGGNRSGAATSGSIMNTSPPNVSLRSNGSSQGLVSRTSPCASVAARPSDSPTSRAPTSRHRDSDPTLDSTPNRGLPSPERVKGREFIYNPAVQAAANSQFDRSWAGTIRPNFMDSLLGSGWDDTKEHQIGIPRGSDGAHIGGPRRNRRRVSEPRAGPSGQNAPSEHGLSQSPRLRQTSPTSSDHRNMQQRFENLKAQNQADGTASSYSLRCPSPESCCQCPTGSLASTPQGSNNGSRSNNSSGSEYTIMQMSCPEGIIREPRRVNRSLHRDAILNDYQNFKEPNRSRGPADSQVGSNSRTSNHQASRSLPSQLSSRAPSPNRTNRSLPGQIASNGEGGDEE